MEAIHNVTGGSGASLYPSVTSFKGWLPPERDLYLEVASFGVALVLGNG